MPFPLQLPSGSRTDVTSRAIAIALTSDTKEQAISHRSLYEKITDYFGIPKKKNAIETLLEMWKENGNSILIIH